MNYGYIRVSDEDQNTSRQIDSLNSICDQLFIEKVSAVGRHRPEFSKLMKSLKTGDTLTVLDLDRAFRSTLDALTHTEMLQKRGVIFRVLSLHVDTSTPYGELFYTIAAAFAQFERRMLIQRTKEGMRAAQKRGVHIGRPHKLSDDQIAEAKLMLDDGHTLKDVAQAHDCCMDTIVRSITRTHG